MKKIVLWIILVSFLMGCSSPNIGMEEEEEDNNLSKELLNPNKAQVSIINQTGATIEERFLLPEGFLRVEADEQSFEEYLRNLPLKPHASKVLYYDGREKNKEGVYIAVVDKKIGDRDLEQCADAIIRLRAEYLYGLGEYNQIRFNFTNGFTADYSKWMEGYRISVNGNVVTWVKTATPSNTYESFKRYLNMVYAYAGTISLEKELKAVRIEEMQIGDVFIQGGSPGHAVIVVDMAKNENTGETLFLLAQSYMPAQETQILINPNDSQLSPWYSLSFGDTLITPEWTFNQNNLKRFQ